MTAVSSRMARMAPIAALLIMFLGGSFPAAAPQAPPARVLVMPFAVKADPASPGGAAATRWLGEAAATLLADELNARGLRALPRADRVDVFDRLQVPMSPELTRATMIRIGELIGASDIVFGEVRMAGGLTVRASTIHLETARQLPDITESAPLSDIFELFGRVAATIGRQAGRVAPASIQRPAPMPLPALENYVKGLIAATPAAQQRFLEAAMGQAPLDARVLSALWTVYAEQGMHDRALAVASAVPPDVPQARTARFNVALSLIELKRFDGAFKELTTLHAQAKAAAVSNALGVTQLRRGSRAGATETAAYYFERAANEAPGQVDYLFNLGYAHALAGDAAGALLWLREVVRHRAGDGDAHLVMAAVLGAGGRAPEAQRELEIARLLGTSLEIVPAALTRVPLALERVRITLEDPAIGLALSAPVQRDQTDTARFHVERARALLADGKDRDALPELRRAVYLAPYEDEPHLLLGRLYQRAGRVNEAVEEFTVAIWCRDSAAARIALGSALVANGDREAAKREFERALALSPDSAEARDWLKKVGGLLP